MKKKKTTTSLSSEEEWIIAYHECGHAIAETAVDSWSVVTLITLQPPKQSKLPGLSRSSVTKVLRSRENVLASIVTNLGGRAAEVLIFNNWYDGSAEDIATAGETARYMVMRLGMSKEFPHTLLDDQQYSERTLERIDRTIEMIQQACFLRAIRDLRRNHKLLTEMAAYLVLHKTIKGKSLQDFLSRVKRSKKPILPL